MTSVAAIDPLAIAAVDDLTFTGRPLLVVDVDEVVVHMVAPFIPWLEKRGLQLDMDSYKLGGNIKYAGTERQVPKEDIGPLIQSFFDEEIHAQPAVDNAASVLGRLERVYEIILLTNAPHRHKERRQASLLSQGVTAKLITNDGPKGPIVARIRERAMAANAPDTLIFIDDSVNNLESVRVSVPSAHLIHFIAHPKFRSLARDVAGVSLKTGDWLDVDRFANGLLGG